MKIYVKTLSGKTLIKEVEPYEIIEFLKLRIQDSEGIFAHNQILEFEGNILEDARIFSDYNIQTESTINMVLRGYAEGGARKQNLDEELKHEEESKTFE